MRLSLRILCGSLVAIGVAACVGSPNNNPGPVPASDPVIGLLDKGITQLNVNISALSKRIDDIKQSSPGTDPLLQEMQALDISGWQLHEQQWVLQRDHLQFGRDLLERVRTNQNEKRRTIDQWHQHWKQYVTALDELRQQRHNLENKHLEVEARLIERGLQ